MADDQMPREARRKGGADTLFSAEWFDDADDFAKEAKGEAPAKSPAVAPAKAAPQPAEAPSAGPSKALIGLVLLVVFLGGGCLASVLMVGGAYALGLFGG